MEDLIGPAVCFVASVLLGGGVFCIVAIQEPLGIAALAGFGAFCIALAVTLTGWALGRSGW